MPGLFDALKEGTFQIFAGPDDPRLPEGAGRQQALISAGLGTLGAETQNPLAALAQGAMFGQQVGQQVREQQVQMQQRAQLGAFVNEAGFDRDGLTKVFFQMLASGDTEGAKSVSEILKSLPTPAAPVRMDITESTIQTEAGPRRVQVVTDPTTGQVVRQNDIGPAIEPDRIRPERRLKGGVMHQVLVDAQGVEIQDLGPVPASDDGVGGFQAQVSQNLAGAMQQAERDLAEVAPELAEPLTGALANLSQKSGIIGFAAKGALSLFPKAQIAAAARERWVAPAVRLMSGAQMTEQERQTYRVAYTPQPFDGDEVQRQKAVARGALAALFADDPDGLEDLPPEQAREILDSVLDEVGLPPISRPSSGDGGPAIPELPDFRPQGGTP